MTLPALVSDCGSCFGLCCVALAFERSADFPVDKGAGEPCVNLGPGYGCSVHHELRDRGYRGCTVYECFGAGQQVSQVTFGGVGWRDDPATAGSMFAALPVMRQLHEMLLHLDEAASRPEARSVRADLETATRTIVPLTRSTPDVLSDIDLPALRDVVSPLLERVSRLVRSGLGGPDHRGASLFAARLRRGRLRGADLRGSLLIAADLRQADLRAADLLGADLRDARLDGADLTGCLFLTEPQLASARGDATTRLPAGLRRPAHWSTSP